MKTVKIDWFLFLMMLSLPVILSGCQNAQPLSRSELVMDTVCTVTIYDGGDEMALNQAFETLNAIDTDLDAFSESSVIGAINQNAGSAPVHIDEDYFDLIQTALTYSEISDGGFDISAGALIDLWAIGEPETKEPPAESEIAAALSLVDYHKVILNSEASTAFLSEPGMKLNLGAVAKGYAAEKVRDLLESEGVERAIINLGGLVTLIGGKTDRTGFSVGITDPKNPEQNTLGVLNLRDTNAVTSGDYQRYFTDSSGNRWHHILDARTGRPTDNALCQVTIVCEDSIRADALSTTLFIMGSEKARNYIEQNSDIEGVLVFSDGSVYVSGGLELE